MRRCAYIALAIAVAAVLSSYWPYPGDSLRIARTQSLLITDRNGVVLADRAIAGGGHARYRHLDEIPTILVNLTLVGEDRRFYEHSGVELRSLLRAAYLDIKGPGPLYGGSTISMQLARMLHPHRRKSIAGKLQDIWYARRLERTLSKTELLEQYLNRAYYGHGAFGVEAAARVYFDKSVDALSSAEAAMLAVLPRAPSGYDPYKHLDRALARRDRLLDEATALSLISNATAGELQQMPMQLTPATRFGIKTRAPHFVDYVVSRLPDETLKVGGIVRTTLDVRLQEQVEQLVKAHVLEREDSRVNEAGAVVLDPSTGGVLAMVGSPDYEASQLNVFTTLRGPGSTLKPFIYALALEQGDQPSSVSWDTRDYPSDYVNTNPDLREHGPVAYRTALGSSYNLSAVHVAERVGLENLLGRLRKAGISTLDNPVGAYGPALAIGKVRALPLDVAAAYSFLVNRGGVVAVAPVTRIDRTDGSTLVPPRGVLTPVFSPETAWQISHMLADGNARRPGFGEDLPFDLPFPVAAKTGTSAGFADNHAIIATRELLVAAWAGNFDGKPMHRVLAMRGAAPLARAVLLAAARGRTLTLTPRPASLARQPVCARSGLLPGPNCAVRQEYLEAAQRPKQRCTDETHKALHFGARYAEYSAQ